MKYLDLSGTWICEIPGQCAQMNLPGTLEENGLGYIDDPQKQWKRENVENIGFWHPGDPIVTRLTRNHPFEGMASISRRIEWHVPDGKRIFVDVERARQLQLKFGSCNAPLYRPACLSTPCIFEITGLVNGSDMFTFLSDNSYPGWPRTSILESSAASDETQTNWNGLLGYIRIRTEEKVFLSDIRVYPQDTRLRAIVEIDASIPFRSQLRFSSEAITETAGFPVSMQPGKKEFSFDLPLRPDALQWDIDEGNLYDLTLSAEGLETRSVRFGIRTLTAADGHLFLNGRRIFLRSEANCAVFPETGYCPMDVESWKSILLKYRTYGVNCMRFHSHCPPEAAFTAADEVGMLMQPELSHWNPVNAFESEASRQYYRTEWMQILRHLACHPSFVMMTMGNELQADTDGHAFMDLLLKEAKAYDSTRLYANGSNVHYGECGADPSSDFYTAMRFHDLDMRATFDRMSGWLNHLYPGSCTDYSSTMKAIRKETDLPVFSFEVGQYEILPDFGELSDFHGITSPQNFIHIRKQVQEKGLQHDWQRMVKASGESSLLCYRAEVEGAMRTADYSGISLLGLQDFPGQGTALVGMMNAHLNPKPHDFARPDRFAAFFRDALPLALLPKYTYTAGETLTVPVRMANYGKHELSGNLEWELKSTDLHKHGELSACTAPAGQLTDMGNISLSLDDVQTAQKASLVLTFCGIRNEYPVWIYPDVKPVCPENVYECRAFDEQAQAMLRSGGIVYLAPDSTPEALPHSIQAQFSPDFWSVCTFPEQEGGMGQLIDAAHPVFRNFPTESYNNWQWWPMANQRAMILPEKIDAIITEMDSYALLRPMAKLFECRCGNGRMMVSSLNLHHLQQYPEARALQAAIYSYLGSDMFEPGQHLAPEWIRNALA